MAPAPLVKAHVFAPLDRSTEHRFPIMLCLAERAVQSTLTRSTAR